MSLVVENYIYYLQYLPHLVGKIINIKDWYGLRDGSSINLFGANKVVIYEVASSFIV